MLQQSVHIQFRSLLTYYSVSGTYDSVMAPYVYPISDALRHLYSPGHCLHMMNYIINRSLNKITYLPELLSMKKKICNVVFFIVQNRILGVAQTSNISKTIK